MANIPYSSRARAVLIDLDGTMVDSAPDIVEASNRMLAELGAPTLSPAVVASFIGNGVPVLVQRLLAASPGLPHMEESAARAMFFRHYHETNGRFSALFPGVLKGLAALQHAGFRIGCVTNKPIAYTEPLLQAFGLERYMQAVIGGDSIPQMKPDPTPLLHACTLLGVAPQNCVMVGDSHVDVAAARAASMTSYIVRYGYPGPGGVAALHADVFIDSFAELPALLNPTTGNRSGARSDGADTADTADTAPGADTATDF
jgi:phosphoglycolate phosphatase